jgi:arsenite methyltransferase
MTPRYGIDAPHEMRIFSLIGVLLLGLAYGIKTLLGPSYPGVALALFYVGLFAGVGMLMPLITIPLGSLFLKKRARDWLLDSLDWEGVNHVLDVGCGRGLLMIGCAKRMESAGAKVTGIDIWRTADQTGNSPDATKRNAEREGVADKVDITTGDARHLPFADGAFDLVVSSWALHNIRDPLGRDAALAEIVRVLRPGGQIAIMDIERFGEYRAFFKGRADLEDVQMLGPRFTFGNRTCIVKARKRR